MKLCPYCAEEIQEAAVFCKHCHKDLPTKPVPNPSAAPAPTPTRTPSGPAPTALPGSRPARGLELKLAASVGVIGFLLSCFGHSMLAYPALFIAAFLVLRGFRMEPVPRVLLSGLASAMLIVPGTAANKAIEEKREEARKETARKAAVEQADRLEPQLRTRMREGSWEEAGQLLERLKQIHPDRPALGELAAQVKPEVEKLRAKQADDRRRTSVAQGITDARTVAADAKLCDTPKAIADAWNKIRVVKKVDPEWSQAEAVVPGLEKCRLALERTLSQGLRKVMIGQREAWAKNAEKTMLDQSMDVEFQLSGPNKDQLRLKWALMGKVAVHQITKDGSMAEGSFLSQMQKVGFRRVTFSDGFDFGVYYTLTPTDEGTGGKTVLAGLGIGSPLVLR